MTTPLRVRHSRRRVLTGKIWDAPQARVHAFAGRVARARRRRSVRAQARGGARGCAGPVSGDWARGSSRRVGLAGASTEAGSGTRKASGTMPAQLPPHDERQAMVQHWQSAFWWFWPGSCRPMTAPLVVQRTMLPPLASVAAWAPEAKERMAVWSRSAQTTTRAMHPRLCAASPWIGVNGQAVRCQSFNPGPHCLTGKAPALV